LSIYKALKVTGLGLVLFDKVFLVKISQLSKKYENLDFKLVLLLVFLWED